MSPNHEHPTEPAAASRLNKTAAPAETVRRASTSERLGHAALFATAACVLGVLALLIAQFGWWSLLFGPAYLCALAVTTVVVHGRTNVLLTVALTTASLGIVVGLLRLFGLA